MRENKATAEQKKDLKQNNVNRHGVPDWWYEAPDEVVKALDAGDYKIICQTQVYSPDAWWPKEFSNIYFAANYMLVLFEEHNLIGYVLIWSEHQLIPVPRGKEGPSSGKIAAEDVSRDIFSLQALAIVDDVYEINRLYNEYQSQDRVHSHLLSNFFSLISLINHSNKMAWIKFLFDKLQSKLFTKIKNLYQLS